MRSWQSVVQASIYVPLVCLMFCLLLTVGDCVAADEKYVVTTRYTVITFSRAEDLPLFSKSINYGDRSLASIFGSQGAQGIEKELAKKIDLLFEKVQAILDMRKEMKPVRVRVYANEEELHEAYEKIYKEKCTVRGWYLYEFNTVFLNVKDVHEGMLAHELGHAIIDHFLSVRPPRATAEILAKYVDLHLHEEIKKY